MRSSTLIKLLALFLPLCALAVEDDFTIYQAKQRPAAELVEVAEGLHAGKVRMRAMDDKVIIYGAKADAAPVLRLFAELDRKARRYRVEVRTVSARAGNRDARAVEASTGSKRVQIGKRSGVLSRQGGARVEVNGVSGSVESESVEGQGAAQQTVLVGEGREAAVFSAEGFLPSGFFVKPRAAGKGSVHLRLRQADAQGIQTQTLISDVDLPLGHWRSVGSVNQARTARTGEILGSAESGGRTQRDIQVRVTLDGAEN